MNKKEFIHFTADQFDAFKSEVDWAVETVTRSIIGAIEAGHEQIYFPGFGTFEIKERPPKKGRNMYTGESIVIPAKKVLQFKPGARMLNAVDSAFNSKKKRGKKK